MLENKGKPKIGNLNGFWSPYPHFTKIEPLIFSKILGIIMALLMISMFFAYKQNIGLFALSAFICILLMTKTVTERQLDNKQSNNNIA